MEVGWRLMPWRLHSAELVVDCGEVDVLTQETRIVDSSKLVFGFGLNHIHQRGAYFSFLPSSSCG